MKGKQISLKGRAALCTSNCQACFIFWFEEQLYTVIGRDINIDIDIDIYSYMDIEHVSHYVDCKWWSCFSLCGKIQGSVKMTPGLPWWSSG